MARCLFLKNPGGQKMRIYICGDSTASVFDPEKTRMVSWGQLLGDYLPEAEIHNHAMAGRSTKTFLQEGRLDALKGEIGAGDLLLIQFAHNDEGEKPERHTEPEEFGRNLERFIRFGREYGAVPILVTPICIRSWKDGKLQPSHGPYLAEMRKTAQKEKTELIDLYEESYRIVAEAGEEESKSYYMHTGPGEEPGYPEGKQDDTHTRRPSAEKYAAFVARKLLERKNT